MSWKKLCGVLLIASLSLVFLGLDDPANGDEQPPPEKKVKHPRGYKLAPLEVRKARHIAIEHRRTHFKHAKKFLAPPDSFDCEAKGWTIPVSDQGDCGSCHNHSAREVASCSFLVAGVFKAPWNGLSVQALMNGPIVRTSYKTACRPQTITLAKVRGEPEIAAFRRA